MDPHRRNLNVSRAVSLNSAAMFGWNLRVPPFLGYLLRREARDRDDRAAHEERVWDGQSIAALPAGLSLTWLGTSGFRMAYQGTTIAIDPYLSRIPVSSMLRGRAVAPRSELIDEHFGSCDAVLLGHTHFDHALDAPALAERGATVYGSRSAVNLLALFGSNHGIEVEPYRTYHHGPFEITFVPSRHSPLMLGLSVPYDGELSCEHFDELTPAAFRCGEVYGIHIRVGGMSFYHQGSADLIDEAVRHRGVDVFLLGIAGRGFSERYLQRVLPLLEPSLIIPHHYDNFFQPLAAPLAFSFNVNLAGFFDEVRAVSSDFTIRTVPRLTPVTSA